ncbi:MAG: hypothetical protein CL489_06230 [Acidobacteria bacterium]|nr:hypothetical protein [Acidobacteriota bacterium]
MDTNDELLQKYHSARKEADEALNRLVLDNQGLVIKIAVSFAKKNSKLDLDDLIQEGMSGLCQAVKKFDPSKGYQFSTYATPWVKQRMITYMKTKVELIKVSPNPAHLDRAKAAIARAPMFQTLHGLFNNPVTPLECLDRDLIEWQEELIALEKAFLELNSRDALVLRLRAQGIPLKTIGETLNISRERVRQLEKRALEKLAKLLKSDKPPITLNMV